MKAQTIIRPALSGLVIIAGMLFIAGCEKSTTGEPKTDNISPEVISVTPVNNSNSVNLDSRLTILFSEKMSAPSITAQSFTLKKGETILPGNITLSNDSLAIFTPAQNLENSTVYSATLMTTVSDLSGNHITQEYKWSFTTAALKDVTAPLVLTVIPSAGTADVTTSIIPEVNFSETINSSTVNSSTFILKQGQSIIPGTITVSGSSAKFSPSSPLNAGTMYNVNLTTGIKDLAGNALASTYSWSFTTKFAAAGKSFSADVVPVLILCNTCHTHGWTTSSNASSFYTNLLNQGYINLSSPASGKIYNKLTGGHPSNNTVSQEQKTTVLTWINEGSKNN
jgi:hypothetical protein